MPLKTAKKISTATRTRLSATFDPMPMPNQMMKSGARITRGMALRRIITGSSTSAKGGIVAAAKPSTTPMTSPPASPSSAAEKVAAICSQIAPLAKSSKSVAATVLGGGA